jgi:DNA-binding MarR family transcriptional regulator
LGIRIAFLIHDVSRLRRTLYDSRSLHLDITRSEAWVLTGISRRRSGISQTELAKVLGLGKVTIGEFVADLERKGFVVRRLEADDRRTYRVQLTPTGRGILAMISKVVARMNAEMFEDFTNSDLQRFADALKDTKLRLIALTEGTAERRAPRAHRAKPTRTRVADAQRGDGRMLQGRTNRL